MPRSKLVLLAVSAMALFSFGGQTRSGLDSGQLTFLGSSLWTKAHDVEIRGTLAYCAFLDGFQILDLADPRDPKTLSQIHLGGGFAVALSGNNALIAAADKGLAVIDVTDPKAPVLRSILDTPGEARDVAASGSLAFVADGSSGLLAVDVSNLAAPKVAGSWDSPGEASWIALRGRSLFLADGSAGLQIVDIADPARLALAGALDTDGTAESVALSGDFAYIADGSGGIKVVNVTAPAGPKLAASLVAEGYAHSVSANGKLLCVGSLYDGGYQILDISDPAAPAVLSTNKYTMYNEGWRVILRDSQAIVVDYFSGIFFVDIADPRKPKVIGQLPAPSSIVAVCGRDRYAFAVGELSGVLAVDAADPAQPILVGGTGIFRGVQNIAANGSYVYVTDRWSIRVYDATDPAKPKQGKPLTFTEGIPRTLVIRGSSAYLTADNFGFYTLDITDPSAPTVVGSFKLPGFTYGLAVSGDRAYLANSDSGLHILDIRDPKAPVEIGLVKLAGEPSGVAVRDDLAYVASGADGLIIVDIRRPEAPKILGAAASGDFSSAVVLDGRFAYVADGLAGVKKIDVSDPNAPRLISSYDTPGEAQNLCVLRKTILVADTYSLILLK
ncbi:MAG: LVIVD repeat-containing protein [Candidatus Aminicenantales bacterium]